jgi:hypothetical protein
LLFPAVVTTATLYVAFAKLAFAVYITIYGQPSLHREAGDGLVGNADTIGCVFGIMQGVFFGR